MAVGIFVYQDAAGCADPVNAWVRAVDFDARDGRGFVEFTSDPRDALRFADARAALEFWRTPSRVRPVRPDGKPNRPLTAYTVSIEQLD